MVYVLSKEGLPLMPTKRHGKVRRWLKEGKAKVVDVLPFTIQLLIDVTVYKQAITLGIDSGYTHVGFSAVTAKEELLAGELTLLEKEKERNKERAMYRRIRRGRLRYRAPRFDNRRRSDDWLAPSILHKLEAHLRLVNKIKKILPITKVVVEVASFDTQKIKNPAIEGKDYQEGEQKDFWNLREYILHRDHHKCQYPECKSKEKKQVILEVHHIGFWKKDRSDRPGNVITLCTDCHKPENHLEGGKLWDWEPKVKTMQAEAFMTAVRWRLAKELDAEIAYGYETKSKRIALGLPKSHANDAFCIAGGTIQARSPVLTLKHVRRNNRSLEKFYDSKVVDIRTGKIVKGNELNCGRRTRNKNLNTENLRKYRGVKVKKGRRSIRKQRYALQPNDMVYYYGKKHEVQGVQSYGTYVKLRGRKKPVNAKKVYLYRYGRGMQSGNWEAPLLAVNNT